MRSHTKVLIALTCVCSLMTASPAAAAESSVKAKDIHKDAVVRYMRWAFERPAPTGALIPEECEVRGRNTFLPSTVTSDPAAVHDDCTAPASKGFFAPVAVCFFFEDATLPRSELRNAVRDCLFGEIGVQEFSATVDGHPVELPRSRSFILPRRPSKVDFFNQGEVSALAGGWFLRIGPLPVGDHEIRSRVVFKDGFTSDVLTRVTVVPG